MAVQLKENVGLGVHWEPHMANRPAPFQEDPEASTCWTLKKLQKISHFTVGFEEGPALTVSVSQLHWQPRCSPKLPPVVVICSSRKWEWGLSSLSYS